MTDRQRNLIIYLDNLCKEKGLQLRASNYDLLGKDWFKQYKNFTPEYTTEVIDKLKLALGMPITHKKPRKGGR